jgi:Asp-tRNA(Asn)/Glu-tRNA(Gln) amidotransferase A subunit family amidase
VVATGYVPFALGSDNCGSLRIPGVYNGAVSLLPKNWTR